jgi:hypothetical protein
MIKGGTKGSNPISSSGESANFQFLNAPSFQAPDHVLLCWARDGSWGHSGPTTRRLSDASRPLSSLAGGGVCLARCGSAADRPYPAPILRRHQGRLSDAGELRRGHEVNLRGWRPHIFLRLLSRRWRKHRRARRVVAAVILSIGDLPHPIDRAPNKLEFLFRGASPPRSPPAAWALTASSTRGESDAQEAKGPSSDPHTLRYLEP